MEPDVNRPPDRDYFLGELLTTESKYVASLELFLSLKRLIEEQELLEEHVLQDVFYGIDSLLAFHQGFLEQLHQIDALPKHEQNWGVPLFVFEEAFQVYSPFAAYEKRNQKAACHYDRIALVQGPPEVLQQVSSPTTFSYWFQRPFSRISAYPRILKGLLDKGDFNAAEKIDIETGLGFISRTIELLNDSHDEQERAETVARLRMQVVDWKGLHLDRFGKLLLFGAFHVGRGDKSSSREQINYKVYLFENILLCCKIQQPARGRGDMHQEPLKLKGRFFIRDISEIKTCTMSTPTGPRHVLEMSWREGQTINGAAITLPNQSLMEKWAQQIEIQRSVHQVQADP